MIGEVVAQSIGAAQVFFLIALICAAIGTVVCLVPAPNLPLALIAGSLAFGFAGLLFFA